jgi:arsenate reductase (thioredoxin)
VRYNEGMTRHRIRVLFLCTGNSARSIIGAALLRHAGGDAFDVHSAGMHPKGINPYTVRVLKAEGIDISSERSKSVDEYGGQEFDYVITVCDDAAEECPLFPGQTQRLHWGLPDPAAVAGADAEKLAAFERTVSQLREHLTTFVPQALAARSNAPAN